MSAGAGFTLGFAVCLALAIAAHLWAYITGSKPPIGAAGAGARP